MARPLPELDPVTMAMWLSSRVFIAYSQSLEWSSLDDLFQDFSGSRNVRVARGPKECLTQRPLSDTQRSGQEYSASTRDFAAHENRSTLSAEQARCHRSIRIEHADLPGICVTTKDRYTVVSNSIHWRQTPFHDRAYVTADCIRLKKLV
jgi:hypothetical protein